MRSALRSPHFSLERDLLLRSFLSLDRDRERFLEGDFFLDPGDFERLFFDFFDLGDLDLLFRRFLPSSPFSFSFFSDLGAGDKLFSVAGLG